ncbi:MAG: MgtC/SapB family protein [Cyanobacteria bacterium J06650_10]
MDWNIVNRLGIALAIGLIIGAERDWQNQQQDTNASAAGVRSFGFVGLLGGLAMLLALATPASMPIVLAALFFGFSLTVAISYWLTAQATKDFGMTTEIALLLTFCLGALSVSGYKAEAIAVAVVVAVMLGLKQEMHRSLSKLNRDELQATLQLLLIGIVALPLLPNQALGPWNAINPRTIGWLVVLIAATSYAGYFAVRLLGERTGLMLTALLGALVSSTAVTISFAQMHKKKVGSPVLLGAGISLAAGTMALRLLIEISVVNASLLRWLVLPIAGLALIPLLAAVITHQYLSRSTSYQPAAFPSEQVKSTVQLKNPLDLKSALFYGAIFTLLFVLVQAAESWFGESGIYLLSGLSGITDVDAVSLSLAASAKSGLSERVAVLGILLAVAVNTLVKAGLAVAIGGWQLAKWSASILLVSLGVSFLTLWLASGLPGI